MPQLTAPTEYRGFVLVPQSDGSMHLINPTTRQWMVQPTQRAAKWSASVFSRLQAQFEGSSPRKFIPSIPQAQS